MKLLSRYSFTILLLGLMVSCQDNSEAYEKRISELIQERDSIAENARQNDAEHQELMSYITGIESALDSISQEEKMLTMKPGIGEKPLTRMEIRERVRNFGKLLQRQREYIKILEDSLRNSRSGAAHLLSTISTLRQQLDAKDKELAKLQSALRNERATVSQLQETVSSLSEEFDKLEDQNTELQKAMLIQNEVVNTGYVLVDNKKKLEQLGILSGGGFLKKKSIDYSAFKESVFQSIDMRTFSGMDIIGKKVKLLTPAPPKSYRLEKIEKNKWKLIIVSPADFWSVSTFMVIQTD